MTANLLPVFAWKPVRFNDAQGTGSVYVPTAAQLTADTKALTYKSIGGAAAALWVAPASGARVTQGRLMNVNATTAYIVTAWVGTAYNTIRFVGAINVPLKSGTDGLVAAVNLLNRTLFPDLQLDAAGNPFYELHQGETLFLTCATADVIKSDVCIQTYEAA